MEQPGKYRLISEEVFAIQRNGTMYRDLEIADWMGRSESYGEYRVGGGEFSVVTPSGSLSAGVDDWIVRCAGRFVPCPAALFERADRRIDRQDRRVSVLGVLRSRPALRPVPGCFGCRAVPGLPARVPASARGPGPLDLSWTEPDPHSERKPRP